jgi:hypothetical protein
VIEVRSPFSGEVVGTVEYAIREMTEERLVILQQ